MGYNGTVILLGPTDCGKTYTLFGGGKGNNVNGIVPRTIQELLAVTLPKSEIQTYEDRSDNILNLKINLLAPENLRNTDENPNFIRVSSYMVHCDKIYDLLANYK